MALIDDSLGDKFLDHFEVVLDTDFGHIDSLLTFLLCDFLLWVENGVKLHQSVD